MAKIRRTREERKQDRSERREGRQLRNELKRLNVVNNKIGEVTLAKEGTRKAQLESKPVLSESQKSDVNRSIAAMKQWYIDAGRYDEGDVLWSKIEGAQNPREVYDLATESFYRDPSDKFEREEFKEYKKEDGLIDFNKQGDYLGSMGRHKGLAPARYMNEAFPEYKPKYKNAREWTGSTGLGSDYYTDDKKEYSKKAGYGPAIKPEFDMTEEVRPEFNKHAGRNPELKPLPVANLEYSFPEETPVSPYNSNQLIESMSKDKTRKQERELRQGERRSERYNDKRERQGVKLAERLAKSDVELKKTAASKFMAENPAVGQTLSQITQGKGFGGYTPPTTTEVDNSAIQTQANSVPTAGMRLASAVANDPNATLTDLNKLSEATTAVNNVQNQQDAAIADEAIATNNAVAEIPKAEVPAVASQVTTDEIAGAEQGGIPSMPIKPAEGIDNVGTMPTERIGGDGQTFVQQQKGGSATFDQGLSRSKVQDEITKGAFKGLSSSPVVAIEKLGVQDYFPNAGESINVGSYSGKYIGNTTIFAAPGARVPFGLYDARMRALKDAAAEKQKIIDKILTAPETAAQFQQQFNNDYFFPMLNEYMEKYGNDPNAILNDPGFRQAMANAEAKARDTKQVSEWAKTVADSYQKPGVYIPKEMMSDVEKILYATGEDYAAYLKGDNTSFGQAMKNVRSYQDMMPHIEELMKTVTAPDRLTERPFDFKKGGQYDEPDFVAGRNKFMQQVFDGSAVQGTDAYVDGVIKYFDLPDIYGSIRAEFASRNASEEQLPYALKYAAGLIPSESIKFSYHMIKTDELDYAKLAEARRQYNTTREDKNASYWATMNEMQTDLVNEQTGISANQNLINIQKKGLKGAELDKAMENHYRTYGIGAVSPNAKVEKDANGVYVTRVPASKKSQEGKLTAVADPNSKTFVVKVGVKKDGKIVDWVDKNLTASQIANSDKPMKIGGNNITADQKKQYGNAGASMYSRVVSYEVKQAFTDSKGNHEYLTADNVAAYNASQQKYTYAIPVERQFTRSKTSNPITGEAQYVDVALPGQTYGTAFNINNRADAMSLDEQSGYGNKGAAEAVDGGTTVTTSGGSETTTQ